MSGSVFGLTEGFSGRTGGLEGAPGSWFGSDLPGLTPGGCPGTGNGGLIMWRHIKGIKQEKCQPEILIF